jgi:hypothetical protein
MTAGDELAASVRRLQFRQRIIQRCGAKVFE